MQQLEGALTCPYIAVRAPQIGVDHAHQSELWKMVPLGNDLGADQDVDLALGEGADGGLGFRRAMQRVGRGDGVARVREEMRELLRHPLDTWSAGDQRILRLALWTFVGRGDLVTALMTGQTPAIAMLDQPGRTMRTGEFMPARLAQG